MRRLLVLLALCLVGASSATAADGQTVRGRIIALTQKTVTVKAERGATSCARSDASPSLEGFAVGDPVVLVCAQAHGRLVLRKAQHVTAPAGEDTKPVTFGGAVTSLSADSISLHDGDRDLTCAIGPASPSTANVKVGQHVKVACAGGVLTQLAAAAPAPQPQPAPSPEAKTAAGNITSLSAASLSIHNDEHGGFDVTCTLGPSSPSLGDYRVGDRVGIACVGGVLTKIVKITR